jgi:ketosteroid isomerase-like protein
MARWVRKGWLFTGILILSSFLGCGGGKEDVGSVKGKVLLEEPSGGLAKDHSGTRVFLKDTEFSTLTDPDGAFLIGLVPAGEYVVVAEREGYVRAESGDIQVVAGHSTDIGVLRLKKGGKISGTALLSDKASHSGILVFILDTEFFTTTAGDGSFEISGIPEGKYKVRFEKEGYNAVEKDVDLKAGDLVKLDLLLTPMITDEEIIAKVVEQLKTAYENEDLDKFVSFISDSYADYDPGSTTPGTKDELKEEIKDRFAMFSGIKVVLSNQRVEVSGNTARYTADYIVTTNEGVTATGTYVIRFQKEGDEWKIIEIDE